MVIVGWCIFFCFYMLILEYWFFLWKVWRIRMSFICFRSLKWVIIWNLVRRRNLVRNLDVFSNSEKLGFGLRNVEIICFIKCFRRVIVFLRIKYFNFLYLRWNVFDLKFRGENVFLFIFFGNELFFFLCRGYKILCI